MSEAIPPPDLVQHASFVRRLAYALLRNDADADDAAQETLARAVERPPRGPSVRAWLATVLKHVVRRHYRVDARRERRETAAARAEATPSAADRAGHAEILRAVVVAVEALDPLSREVVLLRHYEDLPPREIAARLGVPVETVKSRLSRAHDRLRAALAESKTGGVGGWRGAFATLAGMDLGDVAVRSTSASAASTKVAGGVAMSTTGKIGVAVAVVLLVALVGTLRPWDGFGGATSGPSSASEAPVESASGDGAPEKDLSLSAAPHRQVESASAATSGTSSGATGALAEGPSEEDLRRIRREVPPGRIEGIVLQGNVPLAGGTVQLWREGLSQRMHSDARPSEGAASTTIGVGGLYAFQPVAAGEYVVEVHSPGFAPRIQFLTIPRDGDTTRRLVLVLGSGRVAGRAFDREGHPAVGAIIQASQGGDGTSLGRDVVVEVRAGADGAYALDGLPSGRWWISVYLGANRWIDSDTRRCRCTVTAGSTTALDLGSERPEPKWSGVVRGAGGVAVRGPGALLLAREDDNGYVTVAFDSNGAFCQRVPPGAYGRPHVTLPGIVRKQLAALAEVSVGEADFEVDVTIPGARVSGVVRDAGTRDAWKRPGDQWVAWTPVGKDHHDSQSVLLGVDGSFVADGIAPGTYEISGWPLALADSSGRRMTVVIAEDRPETVIELFAATR